MASHSGTIGGLSAELTAKLIRSQPGSLGAASRIQGMTPAALAAIAAHCASAAAPRPSREAFHVKHGSAPNGVSRETLEALEQFTSLLLRWNRTVNLDLLEG